MRRPYIWWCLAAIAVQIVAFATIRHLSLSAFGVGVDAAPEGVVGTAMFWTGAFGIAGVITAIGATWTLLRYASRLEIAVGMLCVSTPALVLSAFECMVWAVSLGW